MNAHLNQFKPLISCSQFNCIFIISRLRSGGGVREGVLPGEGTGYEGQAGAARLLPPPRAHRQAHTREVREGEWTHVSCCHLYK